MRQKNANILIEMFALVQRCGFAIQIVLLCLLWYSIGSASNIVNKVTMQKYPYPLTVSLVAIGSVPLYSAPLFRLWHVSNGAIPRYYMMRYVIPISFGKVLAVVSAYVSIWKVPVSYAQTVKATMPFFAVISARIILNERQNKHVYFSLFPIILGIIIVTVTEASFNLVGFISALISTGTYSVLNVFLKRVLVATDVHPLRLLVLNSQIASLTLIPVWLFHDGILFWHGVETKASSSPYELSFFIHLLLCSLLAFAQNLCAFTLIHRLTALSYAVANATKRITIISVSLLVLHNPVSFTNVLGMSLAIFGVFLYHRARQWDQEHGRLPKTRHDLTMSDASLVLLDGDTPTQESVHSSSSFIPLKHYG